MDLTLTRLVYVSRSLVPPEDFPTEIEAILDGSRRNNAKLGLSGALIFSAGVFAQVLEGPSAQVESVFERLQQDGRHCDIQVLALHPVDERSFPRWSMAYAGSSASYARLMGWIARDSGFDPASFDGDRVLRTVRSIVRGGVAGEPRALGVAA